MYSTAARDSAEIITNVYISIILRTIFPLLLKSRKKKNAARIDFVDNVFPPGARLFFQRFFPQILIRDPVPHTEFTRFRFKLNMYTHMHNAYISVARKTDASVFFIYFFYLNCVFVPDGFLSKNKRVDNFVPRAFCKHARDIRFLLLLLLFFRSIRPSSCVQLCPTRLSESRIARR